MQVDELRIGQRVQYHDEAVARRVVIIPPGRVVGLREKFSRTPEMRLVEVHVMFDEPLFPDSLMDKTYRLGTDPSKLTLLAAEPWSGRPELTSAVHDG